MTTLLSLEPLESSSQSRCCSYRHRKSPPSRTRLYLIMSKSQSLIAQTITSQAMHLNSNSVFRMHLGPQQTLRALFCTTTFYGQSERLDYVHQLRAHIQPRQKTFRHATTPSIILIANLSKRVPLSPNLGRTRESRAFFPPVSAASKLIFHHAPSGISVWWFCNVTAETPPAV